MRVSRTKHVNRRLRAFLYSFLALLVISGFSLLAAWAWQGIERGDIRIHAPASKRDSHGEKLPSGDSKGRQSAASPAGNRPAQTVSEPRERREFPYALRENRAKADRSYFGDAIFFGDSLTASMEFYLPLEGCAFLAYADINPVSASSEPSLLDQAAALYGEREIKKVYIMFGAGSLHIEREDFIKGYGVLIDAIIKQYPGAGVFVQSIPPVSVDYLYADNELIDEYNMSLMQLSQNRGVHFLDVNGALVDEYGNLPQNFAPADGLHLGAQANYVWYEYLRWHTGGW